MADRAHAASGEIRSRSRWVATARATWAATKEDQVVLLAAGVAFFGLIALVPALIAVVSLVGLVLDPESVTVEVERTLAAAPSEVRALTADQLDGITRSSSGGLGVGVVVGLVVALWSASSGMKRLIEAIGLVHDEPETRSFLPLRGLALALTVGAVAFVVVAFVTVAVVPALLGDGSLGTVGRAAVSVLRWPALVLAWALGVAVLFHVAPERPHRGWRWVTPGTVLATLVWLLGSLAFSAYTAGFASYQQTYGALSAVVVTMLWLLVTTVAILVGAELDAVVESGDDRVGDR